MIKFKAVYKSDYNKIVEDNNEFEHKRIKKCSGFMKNKASGSYTFVTKVSSSCCLSKSTYSSRTKNKNDRFENHLICTK